MMERSKDPERENIFMAQLVVGDKLGRGTGHISAEGLSDEAANELAETILDSYLASIDPDAPGCCIDGRCALHTMAGEGSKLELGPHVAGGPLLTAFGATELVPDYYGDKSAPTVLGRLNEVKNTLVSAGIKLGAHITAGAMANGFKNPKTGAPQTGCGLNDEFKKIVAKPAVGSEDKSFIDSATALLMDEDYNAKAMQFDELAAVEERTADYDSHDVLNLFLDKGRNEDKVEILGGEHGEQLVVFNYIKNTTVDRDRLVQDTGKQVFTIDMWYIDKLAEKMAFGRPDAEEMKEKLKHAMVAFQVATYLELCDGTHRPVLFKLPQTQAEAALSA